LRWNQGIYNAQIMNGLFLAHWDVESIDQD
jgi:hypothetical protein